jgi:hypothetical protein
MPWIVKRHRRGITLLSGLSVLVVSACSLWYAQTHPDLRAKVSHIHRGMAKPEIHQIIGVPPGDYRTTSGRLDFIAAGPPYEAWQFDDGEVMVTYWSFRPDAGKCMAALYRESHAARWQPAGQGLVDRSISWLGF